MKTRLIVLCGLLATFQWAPAASAQKVEYATRDVRPTHAIRFSSKPLRITQTIDGRRTLPLADVDRSAEGDRPRRSVFFGRSGKRHARGSIFIGGRGVVIRTEESADREPERPRTVYGSQLPRRASAPEPTDATPPSTGEDADSSAAKRRQIAIRYLLSEGRGPAARAAGR